MDNNEHKITLNNWYTKTTYIDAETGEVLTEKTFKNEYTKIKSETKTNIIRTTGYRYVTTIGRKNNQLKLF